MNIEHVPEKNKSLKLLYSKFEIKVSNSLAVLDPAFEFQLTQIFSSLRDRLFEILTLWYLRDEEICTVLKVSKKMETILRKKRFITNVLGCYRPDFLFDRDSNSIRICEINGRFSLNGFLVSVEFAKHVRGMKGSGYLPSHITHRFPERLKERFENDTVFCLSGVEPKHDLSMASKFLNVEYIVAKDLEVVDDKLFCKGKEVRNILLELHQTEIEDLDESVLSCLMDLSCKGTCLNPLWTIFLVHDKRILSLIREEFVARTSVNTSVQTLREMENFCDKFVCKPALLGKGEGIVIGNGKKFIECVKRMEPPYVVQPYIHQRLFDLLDSNGVMRKWKCVGTMLCMDETFYGCGLLRASAGELCALSTGGIALIPVSKRIAKEFTAPEQMRDVLETDGLAVYRMEEEVTAKSVSDLLRRCRAEFRDHRADGSFVWEITPKGTTSARSHTSEEFKIHTDASFEAKPPRFFLLAVKRCDWTGKGRTSFAKIADCTKDLTDEEYDILRTTQVMWKRPIEFSSGQVEDVVAPVLYSRSRGRIRRDIMKVKHSDDEALFWRAFDKFEACAKSLCEEQSYHLPEASVIICDNEKYVHSRSEILDVERMLYRVRFDVPSLASDVIVTKKDLLELLDDSLLRKSDQYWSPSGGTTSGFSGAHINCLPCTNEENLALRNLMSEEMRVVGCFKGGKIAANLMAGTNMYRSLEVFQHLFVRAGCTELPLDYSASDESVVDCISRFGVNILCGFASRITALASFVHQNHMTVSTINTIIHGGEVFTDRNKNFVKSIFGHHVKIYGVYGSSETGVFSVTNGTEDDVYHYCCDGVKVDILDDNRLIVTNLLRKHFPIFQYDTQDLAERVGISSFRLLGRSESSPKFPLGDYNLDFHFITNTALVDVQAREGLIVTQIHIISNSENFTDCLRLLLHTSFPVTKEEEKRIRDRLESMFDGSLTTDLKIVERMSDFHKSKRSSKLQFFVDLRAK